MHLKLGRQLQCNLGSEILSGFEKTWGVTWPQYITKGRLGTYIAHNFINRTSFDSSVHYIYTGLSCINILIIIEKKPREFSECFGCPLFLCYTVQAVWSVYELPGLCWNVFGLLCAGGTENYANLPV